VTHSEFALGVQRLAKETHTVSSKLPIKIRENRKAMSYRLLELVPLKLDWHLELRCASIFQWQVQLHPNYILIKYIYFQSNTSIYYY
jgi:hypothetical protein